MRDLISVCEQYDAGMITGLEYRNALVKALCDLPESDLLVVSTALLLELPSHIDQ